MKIIRGSLLLHRRRERGLGADFLSEGHWRCLRGWLAWMLLWGSGFHFLKGASPEKWVEVRSPHFVALSEDGEKEARNALRRFEEIREVFRCLGPRIRPDSASPLQIVIVKNRDSLKRFWGGSSESSDRIPPAYFVHFPEQDYAVLESGIPGEDGKPYFALYHEYTHGVLRANFPPLPTWLDEGLADFYGATEIQKSKILIGKVPLNKLHFLREKFLLPMDVLFSVNHASPHYTDTEKAHLFYAQAWATVHYLLMHPTSRAEGTFAKFLKALGEHKDSLLAAQACFGDVKEWASRINAYVRQARFSYQIQDLSIQLSDKDYICRTLSPAEGSVILGEYLLSKRAPALARPILEKALQQASGSVRVQIAMGRLYLQEKDFDKARACRHEIFNHRSKHRI